MKCGDYVRIDGRYSDRYPWLIGQIIACNECGGEVGCGRKIKRGPEGVIRVRWPGQTNSSEHVSHLQKVNILEVLADDGASHYD